MAILAHLDDPPRHRWRGILFGFVLALPLAAVLVIWAIPALVSAVLGGSGEFDRRRRAEDAYMQALCANAFDRGRDEALCSCAGGTEFPALDCQPQFRLWTAERQRESCSDPQTRAAALSFCSCVDVIAEGLDGATGDARVSAAANYERCTNLADALYLPAIEALAPN